MTSDEHSSELAHYLYRSTAQSKLSDSDLDDILEEARRRNADMQLTGCLHYEDGLFFQWIEGPQLELDEVIALIQQDQRHRDLTELSYGPVNKRRFADWAMMSTRNANASLVDWFATTKASTINRATYAISVTAFLVAMRL